MGFFWLYYRMVSYDAFCLLPHDQQLATVWTAGSFLATRWEEEDAVNLYHVGRFFVEVYYDPAANAVLLTRAFTSREGLLDYTPSIGLEDLTA